MKAPLTQKGPRQAAGFSVLELLIVVAMVFVISGFAFMQIVRARQQMTKANAAQQFSAYLEKARVDSVRRHPITAAEMAQVSIVNSTFYTVTLDSDGNGTLDAPRVVSLPAGSNLQFNGPFPRTIYFNWRGRTVDSTTAIVTPGAITISNADGTSPTSITMTSAGQPAIDSTITSSPVTNSPSPAPNFRSNTQVP
jgi:Tfp pilus assembly protein FimT